MLSEACQEKQFPEQPWKMQQGYSSQEAKQQLHNHSEKFQGGGDYLHHLQQNQQNVYNSSNNNHIQSSYKDSENHSLLMNAAIQQYSNNHHNNSQTISSPDKLNISYKLTGSPQIVGCKDSSISDFSFSPAKQISHIPSQQTSEQYQIFSSPSTAMVSPILMPAQGGILNSSGLDHYLPDNIFSSPIRYQDNLSSSISSKQNQTMEQLSQIGQFKEFFRTTQENEDLLKINGNLGNKMNNEFTNGKQGNNILQFSPLDQAVLYNKAAGDTINNNPLNSYNQFHTESVANSPQKIHTNRQYYSNNVSDVCYQQQPTHITKNTEQTIIRPSTNSSNPSNLFTYQLPQVVVGSVSGIFDNIVNESKDINPTMQSSTKSHHSTTDGIHLDHKLTHILLQHQHPHQPNDINTNSITKKNHFTNTISHDNHQQNYFVSHNTIQPGMHSSKPYQHNKDNFRSFQLELPQQSQHLLFTPQRSTNEAHGIEHKIQHNTSLAAHTYQHCNQQYSSEGYYSLAGVNNSTFDHSQTHQAHPYLQLSPPPNMPLHSVSPQKNNTSNAAIYNDQYHSSKQTHYTGSPPLHDHYNHDKNISQQYESLNNSQSFQKGNLVFASTASTADIPKQPSSMNNFVNFCSPSSEHNNSKIVHTSPLQLNNHLQTSPISNYDIHANTMIKQESKNNNSNSLITPVNSIIGGQYLSSSLFQPSTQCHTYSNHPSPISDCHTQTTQMHGQGLNQIEQQQQSNSFASSSFSPPLNAQHPQLNIDCTSTNMISLPTNTRNSDADLDDIATLLNKYAPTYASIAPTTQTNSSSFAINHSSSHPLSQSACFPQASPETTKGTNPLRNNMFHYVNDKQPGNILPATHQSRSDPYLQHLRDEQGYFELTIESNHNIPDDHPFSDLLPTCNYSPSDYTVIKQLGKGKYSEVYLAQDKLSGFLFAVKQVSKTVIFEQDIEEQFSAELKIHMGLIHPNILRLYGFIADQSYFYLFMEYAPDGEVYQLLKRSPQKMFSEAQAAYYLQQLADALAYMHSKKLIHRDLKPENLMLAHGVLKLGDFGYSRYCDGQSTRDTFCGTLDYLSPQVVKGESYNQSTDVWSFGVIAYEMMQGIAPFYEKSKKGTMAKIELGVFTFDDKRISEEGKQFVQATLKVKGEDRKSMKEICRDQWLYEKAREYQEEMQGKNKNLDYEDIQMLQRRY